MTQPTVSKHWRNKSSRFILKKCSGLCLNVYSKFQYCRCTVRHLPGVSITVFAFARVAKKFLRNCISIRVHSRSVNISAFLTHSRLYVCCINHTTVTRWLRHWNTDDDVKTVTIRRWNAVNINSLALAKLSTGSMRYIVTAPLFSSTRTSQFTLLSGTTPRRLAVWPWCNTSEALDSLKPSLSPLISFPKSSSHKRGLGWSLAQIKFD